MLALLKRSLMILLVLRAIVAPVTLHPSSSCLRPTVMVRMRCWPPQRLQRFSGASKLLQLCVGKNRPAPDVGPRPADAWPLRAAPGTDLAARGFGMPATTARSSACLRC